MRYLAISLLLLVFSSCSLKTTEGLREQVAQVSEIQNPYFSNTSEDYVYKAKLDIYGRYFGGILVVKKLTKNSHRVVFTTELGNRIFDFSYNDDSFTPNYVVDQLDKKLILNILERDFRVLVKEYVKPTSQFSTDYGNLYQTNDDGRFNFYKFAKDTKRLESIVNTTKTKEKIIFSFEGDTQIAKQIDITHQSIKFNISLIKFENQ